MYFHTFASSGLRCWLRQIPEERAGVQIQQASPGASVHLQELLGQNLWRTQAPPGVQSWSVQGAAEIRCRGGDLLHGFGDGWGKTGLSSQGYFLIWAARSFNCSSGLRPLDGSRVSPRAQRAFLQSWIRRHQQLSLSGENGQEGWDCHLLLQAEALGVMERNVAQVLRNVESSCFLAMYTVYTNKTKLTRKVTEGELLFATATSTIL